MFPILKKTDLQRFGFSVRRVPRRRGRPVGPVGCTCGRICAALWVTAGALRVCRTLENTCWPHCRLQRRSTMWSLLSRNISNGFSDDEFANGCLLLRACAEGKVELVKQMIGEAPKLLVFSDYDRRTALHVAASEGHLALVQTLLELGANPNRSDRWGGSPLDDSQRHQHPAVASIIRKHGGRGGVQDHGQALIVAACQGDEAEVRTLVSDGAEVNSADYDQRTPLHLASCEGHLGVVSALIELGANVSCTDRWHCTPLDEARRKGNKECERALEKAGALGSMGRELTNGHHHQRLEQRPSEDALTDTNARISSSMMVEWTDLQVVEKIGSGAFGDIFKCRWRGTMVAAKTIKSGAALRETTSATSFTAARKDAVEDFRHEIVFLHQLRHPNVCLMLGYSLTENYEVMISN